MNIKCNNKNYYKLTDLAEISDTDYNTALLIAKNTNSLEYYNNTAVVDKKNFDKLFNTLFEGRHLNTTYETPSWLKNSNEEWCKVLKEIYKNPITHPASISPQQGEFLRSIILNTNPSVVVEIGTFMGSSAIWIGSALHDCKKNGKLYSIDLFNDILPCRGQRTRSLIDPQKFVEDKILQSSLQNDIQLIKGNSIEIGNQWRNISSEKIDVLFIDGDHTIKGCVDDLQSFLPHLNKEGIIILHDIFPKNCGCDGPRFILDNIDGNVKISKFEIKTYPYNFGMAILRFHHS